MSRLIFLDIDGVLNNLTSMKANADCRTLYGLNRDCVRAFDRLIRESGAKVVLSSTWRYTFSPADMAAHLREYGATCEVIDSTPKRFGVDCSRGDEIACWLRMHAAELSAGFQFVILDDDDDMGELINRTVLTNGKPGLTEADVDRALALFAAVPA